jgi:hypothetical protein
MQDACQGRYAAKLGLGCILAVEFTAKFLPPIDRRPCAFAARLKMADTKKGPEGPLSVA